MGYNSSPKGCPVSSIKQQNPLSCGTEIFNCVANQMHWASAIATKKFINWLPGSTNAGDRQKSIWRRVSQTMVLFYCGNELRDQWNIWIWRVSKVLSLCPIIKIIVHLSICLFISIIDKFFETIRARKAKNPDNMSNYTTQIKFVSYNCSFCCSRFDKLRVSIRHNPMKFNTIHLNGKVVRSFNALGGCRLLKVVFFSTNINKCLQAEHVCVCVYRCVCECEKYSD